MSESGLGKRLFRILRKGNTWLVLSYVVLFMLGILAFRPVLAQSDSISVPLTRNLTIGDTGSDVSALQQFLITQGFLDIPAPTGYLGAKTSAALAVWQGTVGLPQTGYFGALSRATIGTSLALNALPATAAVTNPVSTAPAVTPTTIAAPVATASSYTRNLTIGDTGADVSALQSMLIGQGLLASPAPTGYFGPLTAAALAKWQSGEGLPATGYFGTLSRAAVTNTAPVAVANTPAISAPVNSNNPITNLFAPVVPQTAYAASTGGGGGGGGGITNSTEVSTGGGGGGGGGSTIATTDITAPTISITSPSAGSTVSGKVTVTISASDSGGIQRVELYADSIRESTLTAAPYTFTLDTSALTIGKHTIGALAYDNAGNVGIAKGVAITVGTASAPSVPTNLLISSLNTSTALISWSSSQENGGTFAAYNIYRNNKLIGTSKINNFGDSGLTPDTTYAYNVSAYDTSGMASATSSPLSVTTLNLSTTGSGSGSSGSDSSLNYNYGISVGETLMGLPTSSMDAALDDIASLGIGRIRFDIEWDHVQPTSASSYTWTNIDRFVAAATARHIKLLAVIGYTPSWARISGCPSGDDNCLPSDDTLFDNFVKTAVSRYEYQGLIDWEVWNEPNLSDAVEPGNNAQAYTALLKGAYTTIKSQESWAMVLSGGLAPATSTNGNIAPIQFLTEMYHDGAQPYFDALGDHPYAYPAAPANFELWSGWSQMASTPTSLRSIMTANGDSGKKIWMTEFGAPTGGPGNIESSILDTIFNGAPDYVTEAVQAQMIGQAITGVQGLSWAGPLYFYSYKDLGTNMDTIENFFGIIRADGSTKPAYDTIKNLLL